MNHKHIILVDPVWRSINDQNFANGLEILENEWVKPFLDDMNFPVRLRDDRSNLVGFHQLLRVVLDDTRRYILSSHKELEIPIKSFEKLLNYIANEISIGTSLAFSNWFKRHFLDRTFQNAMDDWGLILQYTFFPCQRHSSIPDPPSELFALLPLLEPLIWSEIEANRAELLKIPSGMTLTPEQKEIQAYIEQELYGCSLQDSIVENSDFLYGNAQIVYKIISRESIRKALIACDRLIETSAKERVFQWFERYQNHLVQPYRKIENIEEAILIARNLREV